MRILLILKPLSPLPGLHRCVRASSMTLNSTPSRLFSDPPLDELREGAVFVYPTDTTWGIGCRMDHPESIRRIFTIKQRPPEKTVPVLLHRSDLEALALEHPPEARAIENWWPGALTLVLQARNPESLDPHLVRDGTIALREPDHPPLLGLLRELGPIVGTSANPTGQPAPTDRSELDPTLVEAVDWVLGEGKAGGTSSTVAQWNGEQDRWVIHRQGPIELTALNETT